MMTSRDGEEGRGGKGEEDQREKHSTWRLGDGYNDPSGLRHWPLPSVCVLEACSPVEGRLFKPA